MGENLQSFDTGTGKFMALLGSVLFESKIEDEVEVTLDSQSIVEFIACRFITTLKFQKMSTQSSPSYYNSVQINKLILLILS